MERTDEEQDTCRSLCQTNDISGHANSGRFTEVQYRLGVQRKGTRITEKGSIRKHRQRGDEPVEDRVEHGFGMFGHESRS
jgi:hypothetical protein